MPAAPNQLCHPCDASLWKVVWCPCSSIPHSCRGWHIKVALPSATDRPTLFASGKATTGSKRYAYRHEKQAEKAPQEDGCVAAFKYHLTYLIMNN